MTTRYVFAGWHGTSTRKLLHAIVLLGGLLAASGCTASEPGASTPIPAREAPTGAEEEAGRMWMTVGGRRFAITLADTKAAQEFAARLPLTLDMSELNGNEKHADLASSLPVDAVRPGTIRSGDLMLYGSKTVVVFYETFRSSYAYTRLGRVDDSVDLGAALGRGETRVSFAEE